MSRINYDIKQKMQTLVELADRANLRDQELEKIIKENKLIYNN